MGRGVGYFRDESFFEMSRDGFTILAMGFTGKSAMQWKEKFGKQHYNVIRDIQSLDCSEEFKRLNFQPLKREYRGQEFTYYEITRDGFTFLAMGFTTRSRQSLARSKQSLTTSKQNATRYRSHRLNLWFRYRKLWLFFSVPIVIKKFKHLRSKLRENLADKDFQS